MLVSLKGNVARVNSTYSTSLSELVQRRESHIAEVLTLYTNQSAQKSSLTCPCPCLYNLVPRQKLKKFCVFRGTQMFITVPTT